MPPQGLHSAENVGTAVFRAYRIELKEGEKSSDTKAVKIISTCPNPPERKVVEPLDIFRKTK